MLFKDRYGSTCDSRAALAEIDHREGYEVRLLAALIACTRPVDRTMEP